MSGLILRSSRAALPFLIVCAAHYAAEAASPSWAPVLITAATAPPSSATSAAPAPTAQATGGASAASKSAAPAPAGTASSAPVAQQETFPSPDKAAAAFIAAAGTFNVSELNKILGPDGIDLVVTEDEVQDKNRSMAFAAQAHEKTVVQRDPKNSKKATLIVGKKDWPCPIPIVERNGRWIFDTKAGRQEILYRRIGGNELDAISVCHGYVDAQQEYAAERHDGAVINQYAQKIISTPGKQDGLAWRGPDGVWHGPIGEEIAMVIMEGYSNRYEPYHGYYFKILKKQGKSAAMGEMDFVVKGAMIGGFALVAAPADYRVTGVKSFLVGHDGIVYQKDLGPNSVDVFKTMDTYDPDSSWSKVDEH